MTRTVQQLFDLSGKTALVTGGSRGLGLQMAQALGEAGARVLLTSRKAADLEATAAELKPKVLMPSGLRQTVPMRQTFSAWCKRRSNVWVA